MNSKMKFMFVGDVSLGEHYFSFGHGPRSLLENNESIFESVSPLFEKADLVFANLEGPISDYGYDCSDPHKRVFRGAPVSARELKKAGFNVVNIANNHFVQHGLEAANESVKLLSEEGITVVGLASDPISYIKINDTTVAVIGCSFVKDNTMDDQAFYYSPDILELIDQLSFARKSASLVIVSVHWGIESDLFYSKDQKEKADLMIAAGANIIVGHHPHTLQPVVLTEKNVIAYSVGNFVFDLSWCKKNIESGVLEIGVNGMGVMSALFYRCNLMPSGKPIFKNEIVNMVIGNNIISKVNEGRKENFSLNKLLYFIKNILKGSTWVKLRFVLWKIKALKR